MKIPAFNLRRSIFHICLGLSIISLSLIFKTNFLWFLFGVIVLGIAVSLLSLKIKIPFIHRMLLIFEKPKYLEVFPGKGALFFMAGCLLVLKLFSPNIALASIAILTFGDSISHLIGLSVGKIKHRWPFSELKNIEGTIVGAIAAFIAASFFVRPLFALIASVIAMLAEALTLQLGGDNVDDNLIVPIIAGTIIYLLTNYWAILI